MSKFIGAHGSQVPDHEWAVISPFVRAAISDMRFDRTHDAKNYFTAVTRLAHWAHFVAGFELTREVVFSPQVITNFVFSGCDDLKESSRASYRSRLNQVTDKLLPGARAGVWTHPLHRFDNASAPYSAEEVRGLRFWAKNQATDYRSLNLTLLLALGIGAGLMNSEIAAVQASDVTIDDEGVLVRVTADPDRVGGLPPRVVPMLADWEAEVATVAKAAMRPGQYLICPRRRVKANPSLIAALILDASTPPVQLTSQRLRSTWLVSHLDAGVDRRVLASYAGLQSGKNLTRFEKFMARPDLEGARQLLRRDDEVSA